MLNIEQIVRFCWDGKYFCVEKRAKDEMLPVKLPDGRFISLGNEFTLSCPQSAQMPMFISSETLVLPFEFISAIQTDVIGRPVII